MHDAVSLDFDRRPSALRFMLQGVLPVRREADLHPQISAHWRDHRVDSDELAGFLHVTGLRPAARTLPLLYPHVFGFRLAMAVLTHPAFPVPIWGVLQTRNHLLQRRPIDVDERLDFETRVVDGRSVPKGAEFDLHTTVRSADDIAWESLVTFFTRGRFDEPGAPAALARSPTVTGAPVAEWTLRDADHRRFGRFTGDYNGIHLWDWYARRFGFPRGLYHPPRVLGECLARLPLQADDAGCARLDVWLKGPVHHGARVRLDATGNVSESCFALYADDERPSIVGRLSLLPVGAAGLTDVIPRLQPSPPRTSPRQETIA